ncbi:MAG: hypothetical protein KAX44_05025 [Candidatus Brocadiae bacterium]|nr:hypothetical protein [Candidatus Brocadiia bacterium]
MPHGHDDAVWNAAKREAKEILAERARVRGMIPYSELVSRIQSISFGPHDSPFFHFLGEISTEESQAGRGMMTALVVHKDGDMQPGPGFFDLAQSLGRDTTDITACWVEELKKVHAVWGAQP